MPVDETFRAVELIEAGRYPFGKLHTHSFPIEQAEDAIHALAGDIPGMNPVHLAIVPGAPRVPPVPLSRADATLPAMPQPPSSARRPRVGQQQPRHPRA